MAYALLRKAADITGFSQADLAEIVGVSKQLVQKIVADETPEYLNARQIQALMDAVRLFVDRAIQGLAEMEAFR